MLDRERHSQVDWRKYIEHVVYVPTPEQTAPFLSHFEGREKLHLLDFGCGNGGWGVAFDRDKQSHQINGLTIDVADLHVDNAKLLDPAWAGQLFHGDFADIILEPQYYDGVIAHASIMFQDREALQQSLNKCATALKDKGVLYFTVAQHTDNARKEHITCMNNEEICEAVAQAGMKLASVELDETVTIGVERLKVPLYRVYATKP